jgi:hypothetical protein
MPLEFMLRIMRDPQELWRQYCYSGAVSESGTPDAKQKAFKRAADKLQADSAIGIWNEWVWIIR